MPQGMMENLPTLNALLNTLCTALLVAAFVQIKRGNIEAHRRLVLMALATSILFLVSYLTYHANFGSKRFPGTGWIRPLYFAILLSHTILAAVIVPLVIVTVRRGLRMDRPRHRAIARVTLPMWLYVSVTGVVIYLMLYVLPV
jgi:putative membrane protein